MIRNHKKEIFISRRII